ncbi:peptide ligase PGM1-related protein [Streptomyces sp. NPDC005708]|uniref:preATP grasp domain-containing protein n=1 Tax=Streptomyces sp. NPDC005708 TaxID=3154564 RepID=UPI0033D0635B
MILEHRDCASLVIFANFASEVAVDLREAEVVREWSARASRELWLARPGDILVTPVPLTDSFTHYVGSLLGVPHGSVHVLTVPVTPGTSMADEVRKAGVLPLLRDLVLRRPGIGLLPLALDASTTSLASDLGIPVVPYAPGRDLTASGAVGSAAVLNTKTGFRSDAERIGMRLPRARVCTGTELQRTVRDLLDSHPRLVVKPDRSAGGKGLRFVSRGDPVTTQVSERSGLWVVEEDVGPGISVSAQLTVEEQGPRTLFAGTMRVREGAFTGYVSPPPGVGHDVLKELQAWGLGLGRRLRASGYLGPFDVDAVLAHDGTLYATECNVRRTATTTPYAMVSRLEGQDSGHFAGAWLIDHRHCSTDHGDFEKVRRILRSTRLAYDPDRGEGIVLYSDMPGGGTPLCYAVIAPEHERLFALEADLADVLS